MANANFDGGSSQSVSISWTGWGGVDSTGSNGVDLPTNGTLAFNGNRPVYVTTARFFVAGRGGTRSLRFGIGGQYTGYQNVGSASAAVARDVTMNKVWQNGGSNLTTRINGTTNDGFYFGRGADGTGNSTDDNGNTWSGSLSGYATYFYVPTAPTIGTAIQDGVSQDVNLTWTAPTDTQGGITGYTIDYSTTSSFTGYTSITVGNVLTYKVTGLIYGQTYYFRVRAINAAATAAGTTSVASGSVSTTLVVPGTDGWTAFGTLPTDNTLLFERNLVPSTSIVGLHRKVTATATGGSYTSGNFGIERVLTGLEIGRVYKINAKAKLGTAGIQGNIYRLAVVGKTAGATKTLTTSEQSFAEYSFTATATSHTIRVELAESYTVSPTGTVEDLYVYSLEVTRVAEDLTVTKGYYIQDNLVYGSLAQHYDLTMTSIGGFWWVDKANRTQFAQDLDYITPVATFTDGQEFVGGVLTPGQSEPGELHYNTIEAGYDTSSVVNDVTISNEGLSPYEGNDTVQSPWQANWNQTNSTSQDAWGTRRLDLRTNLWLSSLDNLVTNPSFEVNIDSARNATGTTNSATKQVSVTPPSGIKGSKAIQHKVKVADNTLDIYLGDTTTGQGGDYNGIVAGQSYSAKAYVRKTTGTTNARATVQIRFYDEQNDSLGTTTSVYTTLSTTNQWYEVTQTFTAPAGSVSALVRLIVNLSSGSNVPVGAKFQWDAVSLIQDGTPVYFDGDTTDTTSYIYDWLGSRHQSISRRSVNRLYTRATDILTDFANPAVRIKAFTWNAAEDPIVAAQLDVGSLVYMKFNGVSTLYRVAGLSHDITPNEWIITAQVQKAS
jgi:hypothetical protein